MCQIKNIKQMEIIAKIRKEIRDAKEELENLKRFVRSHPSLDYSFLFVSPRQDRLKERLQSISSLIGEYFRENPSKRRSCKNLLGKVFEISEDLKLFYITPAAYDLSLDIFDTMKMLNKRTATD